MNSFMTALIILSWLCCFGPVLQSSEAFTLEAQSGYMWDFLVTGNWDTKLNLQHTPRNGLEIEGRLQHLDAAQDSISGLKPLREQVISALAGIKWTTLNQRLVVEADVGADYITNCGYKPRLRTALNAGIPLPANRIIKNLRIKPESWYTYRNLNGAMLANRINSSGWNVDFTAGLGSRFGLGANYRNEFLTPDEPVLDTSFFQTVLGGAPPDTLDRNRITGFYAYIYASVMPWFQISYAYSWSDSREDRWVVTRREPAFSKGFPPRPIGTLQQYAYYPYPTPVDAVSHLVGINIQKPLNNYIGIKLKTAIPFLSRRRVFSSPLFVDQYYQGEYYTEEQTGPLSLEAGLIITIDYRTALRTDYEYFCIPYRKWAYFTSDKNSYSYHKLNLTVKRSF